MSNNILCYISYDKDYPEWSDVILTSSSICDKDVEKYIKDLITAIEWSSNQKVKALKLELNEEDTSPFKINKTINYKVEK